jgi:predicted ATPase/transcriptional regulator with XRE-family HTH domain
VTHTGTYSLGVWIKQRREAMRLTQRDLAAAVHCSVPMLKKIEGDDRRPSTELARLLARALKLPDQSWETFVAAARGDRSVDTLWPIPTDVEATIWQLLTPAPLPKPATAFIGRAQEIQDIGAQLSQDDCRLLTLVGPGGMGKTRLALQAAEAYAEDRPAVFVPLVTVSEAAALPEAVAHSLRLALSGPPAEQVVGFLRRQRLLLILDNCEQLAGNLEWLAEVVARAPGVKLLATSRERLHLAEEWVYAVPTLAQAEALFVDRVRRVKQNFSEQAERPAIGRICALLGNLPLAVELAAGWTPLMSCEQIAGHLANDLALLATDLTNIPERHRSLEAVCEHSWQLLTAPEQHALKHLSVFNGGWLIDQAQAVAGADLKMLRWLVDKSLVRVGEHGRFDLHELIRQDAARRLAQTGEAAGARRAHFVAYQALAARLDEAQFGPEAMTGVARFDHEQGNLRAALKWGLEANEVDAVLELLSHLWFYWSRRGAYREGTDWARRVIEQAGDRESVPMCLALGTAVIFAYVQGHFAEAQALAQRTATMAHRLEDPEALIMAYGLATSASLTFEEAMEGLQKAIQLSEATGKRRELRPLLYNGAATWLHSSGRYSEARAYYEKSVELFRELGAVDFISDPLGRLGQLALQEGRLQDAHDLTMESIAAARAIGLDVFYGTWESARLGQILLYQGDLEAAQQTLEIALARMEDDAGYVRSRQETLAVLSEVALMRGDITAAAEHMRASLLICGPFYRELQEAHKLEGTGDSLPVDLVALCARAGLVAAAQGMAERAVTLFGAAEALAAASGLTLLPALRERVEKSLANLRETLGAVDFGAAQEQGRGLSLAQAFAFLLGE